ncbi:MAG: efflux RND transporter permease subunit [Myxococcota bacterium]
MLTRIVDAALHHRGVVIALTLLALVFGVDAVRRARLDVFPEFASPQIEIQTEAPGFATDQVELLVTAPLESALAGMPDLEAVRSESVQGLSVVRLVFDPDAAVTAVRQAVSERLSLVALQLPPGIAPPTMSPLTSATMDVLKIGLVSDTLDPADLRDLADTTVRRKLLAVPGVARVNVFGGDRRQLRIALRPERLIDHGLALTDLLAAARRATGLVGAGFVETPNQRIALRTEGEALDANLLGAAILGPNAAGAAGGTSTGAATGPGGAGGGAAAGPAPGAGAGVAIGPPVRLRDVATVHETAAPRFGDALIQGRPGVLLTISSAYGANTLEVTRALERALGELAPVFAAQQVVLYPRLHRPARFIESALANLRFSLVLGGLLVAAVLVPMLGRLRPTLISIVAIPLSLLGAVFVLERLGITLNTMTLGGLAIAIGEVVDDAIIDVENIVRRLRENARARAPRPAHRVVLDASIEVRGAVVYATWIVALVFVPLLTLSGLAGRFFAPLGLAYLLAVLVSLGVALVVTPALCLLLLRGRDIEADEPRIQHGLKRAYAGLLERAFPHARALIASVGVLTLAALAALSTLGGDFLPTFREGHLVLQVAEAPGASLPELLRVGRALSTELLALPGVATVEQQVGRAERGEDTWGPHRSELHVELANDPANAERETTRQIRAILARQPGIQFEVLTFLADRIGETLTGQKAPFVVDVFGSDLDALDAVARQIAGVLEAVPGASEVQTQASGSLPTLSITLRREALAALGFLPVDVLDAVRVAYQGEIVGQVHRGEQAIPVVTMLDDAARRDPARVGTLMLRSASGVQAPLAALADLAIHDGREAIFHDGLRRRQSVTCVPRDRDAASFGREAEREIRRRVVLPPGTYLEFGGTARAQRGAQRDLAIDLAAVLLGVVLLLQIAFRSGRSVGLILCNVPFGLVGGVLAILAARALGNEAGALTMGSLVGFVTIFGITMRNSIMLVSHYAQLADETGLAWGPELARRGALDRVVPITMTALVTGLGLLPLALGSGDAGREIEGPMAVVILGGLASSTLLNLIVLPVLALRFGRFDRAARARSAASRQEPLA